MCNTLFNSIQIISLEDLLVNLSSSLISVITIEVLIAIPTLIFAVSIPLSIFIVEKSLAYPWDIRVVMVKVLRSRRLISALITYMFVMALWQVENIRIILFGFGLYCIYIFLKVIVDGYKWLTVLEHKELKARTYRSEKRLEYLKSLDLEEFSTIISTTWQEQVPGTLDNRAILALYTKKLKEILGMDNLEEYTHVIDSLANNIRKVNLEDQKIHYNILSTIIPYLFNINSPEDFYPNWKVSDLYDLIIKEDLKTNVRIHLLFHDLKKTLKEFKINEPKLAQQTLKVMLNEFNEDNIESVFQRGFPETWLITYDNLINTDSKSITYAVLSEYIYWLTHRALLVDTEEVAYDSIADRVTRKLLPKVDPITWTDLMALIYSSFGFNNNESPEYARVQNFLNNKKSFGHFGSTYSSFGNENDHSKDLRQQELDSIDEVIAIIAETKLFPSLNDNLYVMELLNIIEDIIKSEKLKEGSIKYSRCKRLSSILNRILNNLSK